MTETLSNYSTCMDEELNADNWIEIKDKPFYREKDVKKSIKKFKENLWNHKSKFEGVKCKTCLPLDYVDDELNSIFGSELT